MPQNALARDPDRIREDAVPEYSAGAERYGEKRLTYTGEAETDDLAETAEENEKAEEALEKAKKKAKEKKARKEAAEGEAKEGAAEETKEAEAAEEEGKAALEEAREEPEEEIIAEKKRPKEARATVKGPKVEGRGLAGRVHKFISYFHPYVSVDTVYDDNIFQLKAPNLIKPNVINVAKPGVKFCYGKLQKNNITFDGGARFDEYYMDTQLNDHNPRFYGNGSLQLTRRLFKGQHKLNIGQFYEENARIRSSIAAGDAGLIDYTDHTSTAKWTTLYKRLGVEVTGKRTFTDYEDPMADTSTMEKSSLSVKGFLKHKFLQKVKLLGGYDYANVVYPRLQRLDMNYKEQKFWLGAERILKRKIYAFGKVEYLDRKYTDWYTTFGASRSYVSFIYTTGVVFRYSPRMQFDATASLEDRSSESATQYDARAYDFHIGYNHQVTRRFKVNIVGDYSIDQYSPKAEDRTYGYTANMACALSPRTSFAVQYKFEERDTNRAGAAYKNNVCTINVSTKL